MKEDRSGCDAALFDIEAPARMQKEKLLFQAIPNWLKTAVLSLERL
ncbi:hypothetical protein [Bradyrhizobium prioriisuperbiae]|nr:hypothetical protein [Bradyrhizobium prioritasuperba]